MNRRDFFKAGLKSATALGAASMLGKFGEMSALAATNNSGGYNALVCIFLLGGNDGHNTVIPIQTSVAGGAQNYQLYQKIRQNLALPQGQLNVVTMKNGDVYGLHPQLKAKYFRVGHMGGVTRGDLVTTVSALERALKACGHPVELGRGVAALG